MRFKITSAGNNSTFGDVFFSVPTKEEMQKAEKTVAEFCHEKALKIYKENQSIYEDIVFARIEMEIERMCVTETVYHFLVLKEIAEVSRKAGFPIMTEGNLSGSIISYLLGITEYDPLSFNLDYTPIQLLWGTDETILTPDFSTGIAPQIRPLIHSRLDSKYGFVDCNKDIYKQISLTDVTICERLGQLLKATDIKPSFKDYDEKTYIQVVKNIADDYICEFEELNKEGYMFDEELPHILSFAEELKLMKHCNFKQLLSLYAYRHGSFKTKKSLNTLSNDFFTTRDEFFNVLIYHNVPNDVALDIVKKGVWSTQDKRKKYEKILSSYNTPEYVFEYFSNVNHLFETHTCISRLVLMCAIAWYQINYPTEFTYLETENCNMDNTSYIKNLYILKFINSKDIREYLKTTNYEFNSLEAAWLIYQCTSATIKEKHLAWRKLIKTMPDCKIPKRMNTNPHDSLHHYLRKYINYEDSILDDFFTSTEDWIYTAEWLEQGIWFSSDKLYKTFEKAKQELLEEHKDWERKCIYRITKQKLESKQYISVYFDKNNEPYDYDICEYPEKLTEILYGVFDGLWFDFPTPFKKGDILCQYNLDGKKTSGFCRGPFVMKGITPDDVRDWTRKNGDTSDMNAWGYFQDTDGTIYHEVMHNYMDLEYYHDELTGKKRILKALSNFVKGEIDVEFLCRAYHSLMCDEYTKDSIPCDFTDEDLKLAGIIE